jgi:hypothetical protein
VTSQIFTFIQLRKIRIEHWVPLHPRVVDAIKLLLDGLYRCDYLDHCRLPTHDEPSIDAVLLSHAHMDHSSHIHYLREDVPIHCTQASKDIMQALDETGSTGTRELISLKESFKTYISSRGTETKLKGEVAKKPRPYEIVEGGFALGGFEQKPPCSRPSLLRAGFHAARSFGKCFQLTFSAISISHIHVAVIRLGVDHCFTLHL